MVVEDFAESLGACLALVPGGKGAEQAAGEGEGPYLVAMARYLSALGAMDSAAAILPTVLAMGEPSVEVFRQRHVEATRAEADHLAISCLASVTGIPVTIVSLSDSGEPAITAFPAGAGGPTDSVVHLLLRPGHYDVLLRG